MTQLGLGTATFLGGYGLGGDTPSADRAAGLMREAFAEGIRYVDTAAAYGEAERVLGRVAEDIREHAVRVSTKVKARAADLLAELRSSLARLGLSRVDTLLLHSADTSVFAEPALRAALAAIREQGLVSRTGASTYGIADARAALAEHWCDALQVEHSVLNPSVVRALSAETGGTEIIARSVLCKGLLTTRRVQAMELTGELGPTLDCLERLAAEWGWPLPEIAIRYALDTPGVDIVLVGVSTEAELKSALAAERRTPLGPEARALLSKYDRSDADAAHPERWVLTGS